MYQLNNLDTLKVIRPQLDPAWKLIFTFELTLNLSKSEAFYLWNLLRQGKETTEAFTKKYTIDFHSANSNVKNIETDGRYFKFIMLDGSDRILDIGYNYFDVNGFSDKLKSNYSLRVHK